MLQQSSEKTAKFLEAINQAALEKCRDIEQEVAEYTRIELQKAEDEARVYCHKLIKIETDKIKAETRRISAQHETGKRAELCKKRDGITDQVFESVRAKLTAYTASDEYRAFLLSSTKALSEKSGEGTVELKVKRADLKYADEIKSAFGRACEVTADDTITIGGIKAVNKGLKLVLNDTFDIRLAQQRNWFLETNGMSIV